MVSSSSSGGAGEPVSARASVPLRRGGCCCCCPFYSRGCDLNLYLWVSSLQTPPRSRHRLPRPAGRAEGAEAGKAGGLGSGMCSAAAAAPQHRPPRAVRCGALAPRDGRLAARRRLPAGRPARLRRRSAGGAAGAGAGRRCRGDTCPPSAGVSGGKAVLIISVCLLFSNRNVSTRRGNKYFSQLLFLLSSL